ncbi:NAD(P)H-dependent FMN reductase [Actinoplanes lutulentus]|uniref:NAD(P)H-dependent FMN reductase n=1 Tax=Actinoplanes lutulentus TaxID=1287878 RepID=A0A327YW17_9ACTN|nr:NAD(P)H-dependent oxidoreductase [Actinoplanes lutulentus]MBB2946452.1 NAD(P)H-dependent FMN reductase [Actinoplanes lutulentus]RAK25428.1 NAD(P)H-dependent FMN reductase [Actinoplanes lutulentus]
MSALKIAVVLGSTRPGRKGAVVADWVLAQSAGRTAARYELLDLADYPLPHLDEPVGAKVGPDLYSKDHTKAWAGKVAEYDGFVFVTPEYNHSTSGVLKNAIDFLYQEWTNKAAGLVSYGAVGGARAIEHLRGVLSELQMAHVQQQLSFSLYTDFENFSDFAPAEMHAGAAQVMFDQLESWAGALRDVRESALAPAA